MLFHSSMRRLHDFTWDTLELSLHSLLITSLVTWVWLKKDLTSLRSTDTRQSDPQTLIKSSPNLLCFVTDEGLGGENSMPTISFWINRMLAFQSISNTMPIHHNCCHLSICYCNIHWESFIILLLSKKWSSFFKEIIFTAFYNCFSMLKNIWI